MNYIQQLKEENREMQERMFKIQDDINNRLSYLASDKFHGPENNYINAREIYSYLVELRMKTIGD